MADKGNHRIQKFHEEADPPVIPPVVAGPGYLKITGGQKGYVNPTLGETCLIQFTGGLAGAVSIYIFNSDGILLRTLAGTSDGVTKTSVIFDCKDSAGKVLSSGIYTVKMNGVSASLTKKFAIAR